ncbi:MAG: hypothetical protein LBQ63_05810 [Deltaproteobacteria bacterium]|jgi:hypothetical protein|nr:hypothetical protein [Deltaproteobacteria bacterium]
MAEIFDGVFSEKILGESTVFLSLLTFRPKFASGRAGLSLLRTLLMLILILGVCWAFWANSERYVYKFSANARLNDDMKVFSPEQSEAIVEIIVAFDKKFSVKLHVQTRETLFSSQDALEGKVLFGICPPMKQTVLFMPALWRSAIGEGTIFRIQSEIMYQGFESGQWREAAVSSLLFLEYSFETVAR